MICTYLSIQQDLGYYSGELALLDDPPSLSADFKVRKIQATNFFPFFHPTKHKYMRKCTNTHTYAVFFNTK